ncbi:MAG TPA: FG-GAP-like repeat-containing protein, partial [Thermoanaerobaculia bacterium]|nr:FG-GAP-like repeat-containing protein [Thermoanaerobaculia bacterium]
MQRPNSPSTAVLAAALAFFLIACDGASSTADPNPAPPAAGSASPGLSEQAGRLRNAGFAQLENEKPAEAEQTYRKLAAAVPGDPLPQANLAVALLRQQKTDEALAAIDKALQVAPKRADLLSIRAEVLAWSGRNDEAIIAAKSAMQAAPDDPETVYQLHRTASAAGGEAAEKAMADSMQRLATLRPDNVVVMLDVGRRGIADGDRAAATQAFLRLRELVWQSETDAAAKLLADVLAKLESGEVSEARVPAQRLENVLKVTAMYQQSLRELWTGIVGIPVARFASEPPPADFGNPVRVSFAGSEIDGTATAGAALAVADFDGDGKPDVARVVAGSGGGLEIRLAAGGWKAAGKRLPVASLGGTPRLLAVDLDNDSKRDLLAYGPRGAAFFRGDGAGGFSDATAAMGLAKAGGGAAAAIDFDIEGDLDLALAGGASGGGALWRNNLAGALQSVGDRVLPKQAVSSGGGDAAALVASDLDRDGDLDLLRAAPGGLLWLDNLRQGKFADRTGDGGLGNAPGGLAAVSADLDNDGRPDLVTAGGGSEPLAFHRNRGDRFAAWNVVAPVAAGPSYSALVAFDADNDGHLDLAVGGDGTGGKPAVALLGQREAARFAPIRVSGAPAAVTALAAADLDGDGDLDLVAAGPQGLHRFENRGGDANNWLAVDLTGLATGSSKNNVFGLGAVVEVRDGLAYQFREGDGNPVHFGLGKVEKADALRVVWPNGVPQDRVAVAADQRVVEEQLLKGSCPFLYTWDGERVAFVTDLLWGSPIGLPVAEGVYAGADPGELVRVDGAAADGGTYRLKVTEELWEAAFFDHLRLWVVDHPAGVEVASNLRVLPGHAFPEEVRASRDLRPLAAAWDGTGRELTGRLAARDEVYADGWSAQWPDGRYQGLAPAPWALTFDLGTAPAAPVRLHLDGWIFPADASLNLAIDQRADLAPQGPRLEVETADGWQVLIPAGDLGFPAGKTKTMVVDTPPLPEGATRLRLVSN